MKTEVTLTIVRPPATVAMILGTQNPRQPGHRERAAQAAGAAHADPQERHQAAAKFRDNLRRRYETPLQQLHWQHDGINVNKKPV